MSVPVSLLVSVPVSLSVSVSVSSVSMSAARLPIRYTSRVLHTEGSFVIESSFHRALSPNRDLKMTYGVATISRIDNNIDLFCRIASLL